MKKEAYAENLSCLSHWEPTNLPRPPSCGQDDQTLLMFTLVSRKFLAMRNIALYSVSRSSPVNYLVKSWKCLTRYLKVTNSTFLCSLALGLNGRPPRPIGALGSSKIYRVSGDTVLCYPLIFSGEYCFLFLSSHLQKINYFKTVI